MSPLIDVQAISKTICEKPIQGELAYATPYNFIGRIINGYYQDAKDFFLLTPKAAVSLCNAQNELIKKYNMGVFIFDSYRPKRAVMDFLEWSRLSPVNDFELERKALHYPHIEKKDLFNLGYIAVDSNHCYGNTVDLVLIDLVTHTFLDMGAIFDYMDVLSHHTITPNDIGETPYRHRQILKETMEKFGFESYEKEFWHYSHGGKAGREVSTALDIEITKDLKGIK